MGIAMRLVALLLAALLVASPAVAATHTFAVELAGEYMVDLADETHSNWGNSTGGVLGLAYTSNPRVHVILGLHYGQRPFESIFLIGIPEHLTLSIDAEQTKVYGAVVNFRILDDRVASRARTFGFLGFGVLHSEGGEIVRTYRDVGVIPEEIHSYVMKPRVEWQAALLEVGFGVSVRLWGESRAVGQIGMMGATDREGASFPLTVGLQLPLGHGGVRASN